MLRFTTLCLLAFFAVSCSQVATIQTQNKSALPSLLVSGDTSKTALHLSALNIQVTMAGNIATTTFDLTFYNPFDRVLEGSLEFPLADGQEICRYALEVNGHLREGVVVEKAKARVAFENTERRRIDPGLVEKTLGNNLKTRIYPIPAKGYKRVVIATEQVLEYTNSKLLYQLPIYAQQAIGHFSFSATVLASAEKPVAENNGPVNFSFKKADERWQASFAQNNFLANGTIAFAIVPAGEQAYTLLTEAYNGNTYFYLSAPMEGTLQHKPKPYTILVLWVISASAENRQTSKEQELLSKYISALNRVNVQLIPFNISPLAGRQFTITNGDASDVCYAI